MTNVKIFILSVLAVLALVAQVKAENCPDYLNHTFKKLHSEKTLNICDAYFGKVLLVVNTASFCGYTPQFAELQKLNKKYREQGLIILGFASDDFFQESNSEQETAKVCFINYGVTFDMFSPIHVRRGDVHPLFKTLSEKTDSPSWNFNKYLIDKKGNVIKHFGSNVAPESTEMQQAIELLLSQ
jgi:glutathione peroxidase